MQDFRALGFWSDRFKAQDFTVQFVALLGLRVVGCRVTYFRA